MRARRDNTTATPLGQRPLELGVDLAVVSDTKARWGDPVAPGHLRFSVSIEDTADLVADVRAALDALTPGGHSRCRSRAPIGRPPFAG